MNEDTVNLLKECNAGCKSATNSMEQIMIYVKDHKLKSTICEYNNVHIKIGDKCHVMLNKAGKDEEDPGVIAKFFSWIGTEMKLMADAENHQIADILIDGCNMGIKSVSEYINKYKDASKESLALARSIVTVEEKFMSELLQYL